MVSMTVLTATSGLLIVLFVAILLFTANKLVNRQRETQKAGFLVADRQAPWLKTSFSISAAWVWAPALFVAAQQAYQNGWVGVFWFMVPNVLALILFSFFASRVRMQMQNGFTLSGYIREKLGPGTQKVYSACLLLLALLSFAVQLLAGGLVIATLTGLPYPAITVLLAIIAVAYSYYSGLKASLITGTIKMAAIFVIGVGVAVAVAASSHSVFAGLGGIDHNTFSLTSGAGVAVFWSFGLSTAIGLLSGPFGDQAMWQRAFAVKRGFVSRSFVVGAIMFAVVPLTMSILGFALAGAGVKVENLQLTNITAVITWLPNWVVVCFAVMVIIGLISTLDSNLCAASSIVGNDFSSRSEGSLRNARIAMVVLATLGVAVANIPGLTITKLFIIYGTLRASSFVPTVTVIATRLKLHGRSVSAGIITALVVGVPMSAYGNLNNKVAFIVGASITVLLVSGGISLGASYVNHRRGRRFEAPSSVGSAMDSALVTVEP